MEKVIIVLRYGLSKFGYILDHWVVIDGRVMDACSCRGGLSKRCDNGKR